MPATLGQLLYARSRALVGRDRERAALMALVHRDRPRLAEVIRAGGLANVRPVAENPVNLALEARP